MLLSGCAPAQLDGSSEDSLRESSQALQDSISAEERERYVQALQIIAGEVRALGGDLSFDSAGRPSGEVDSESLLLLDGKSADEVIALGEEALASRRERHMREVEELNEKKRKSAIAAAELAKFEATADYWLPFFSPPILEITVRNGTAVPVSRAHFEVTLASPGRSIPWFRKNISYPVRGGLEPGEEGRWSLTGYMPLDWDGQKVPKDSELTLVVTGIDGPDGEPAFGPAFSALDAARLEQLTKKLDAGGVVPPT